MSSHHLSVDDFFLRLADLFETTRTADHGSVFLTQKRLSHGPSTSSPSSPPSESHNNLPESLFADLHPAAPLPVLMRATNGKMKEDKADKVKLSTVVMPDRLEGFYARYAEIWKAGMGGLRKRDRSGRKKKKAGKRKVGDGEKKI
ncbi:hypothetical protein MMC19_005852 [Ptychographa xylographoides]|nr:hypothetical protein [Ptychographa xylographoides]